MPGWTALDAEEGRRARTGWLQEPPGYEVGKERGDTI